MGVAGFAVWLRVTVWLWLPLVMTSLAGFQVVASHLTMEPSVVTLEQALLISVPSTVRLQLLRLLPLVKRTATYWPQSTLTSLVWSATTRSVWVLLFPPEEEEPPELLPPLEELPPEEPPPDPPEVLPPFVVPLGS